MKTKKIQPIPTLKKQTIATLNSDEMKVQHGGAITIRTWPNLCLTQKAGTVC